MPHECGQHTSAASRNTASWHQVADSVQIRLPSGWRIAAQKQVAGHEKERKEIDAQVGLQPKVEPRDAVTFQAEKSEGTDSIFLGVTVVPALARQN